MFDSRTSSNGSVSSRPPRNGDEIMAFPGVRLSDPDSPIRLPARPGIVAKYISQRSTGPAHIRRDLCESAEGHRRDSGSANWRNCRFPPQHSFPLNASRANGAADAQTKNVSSGSPQPMPARPPEWPIRHHHNNSRGPAAWDNRANPSRARIRIGPPMRFRHILVPRIEG